MAEKLQPPKNTFIEVTKIILEKLIEGVGVEITVAAAVGYAPWLATPFVNFLFKKLVQWVADFIDTNLFNFGVKIILRIQSTPIKNEFNESIKPIIEGNPSDEEIERARAAAIRVIERNRP